MFFRRRRPANPALTAYRALDRYVLVPHAVASTPYRVTDLDLLRTLPCGTPDLDLGAEVEALLRPPRTLRGSRAHDEQAFRRLLQQAFGVRTDRAWLSEATCVSVERLGDTVRVSPWRHHGQRKSWAGRVGDPVAEATAADAEWVGRALREMLEVPLPPG